MEGNFKKKLNERGWALLLEEINRGNVIPVIGKELISIHIDGKDILLKDYIVKEIASRIDVPYEEGMDFSHLSYEYNPQAWNKINSDPYYMTKSIVEELYPKMEIPQLLTDLFSIDKFDNVITTSFDDFVFKAMEKVKGTGNVKQLSYKKHSSEVDIKDNETGFVYHMFGKTSAISHEYVLTDDDLLEFMHCWLDDNYRPKRLANMLRDKYLLVIGCNYPNWLFRFFFHSLKYSSTNGAPKTTGMLADSKLDSQLIDFLSRMNAGVYENAKSFVYELLERWNEHYAFSNTKNSTKKKKIFISYASEDYVMSSQIASIFSNLKFDVWFDKRTLEPGDEYEKLIRDNIQSTDAFVPILSESTAAGGRRFFRREWKWANDESEYRFPNKFIYPICIDGVNLNNELFSIFSKLHAADCSSEDSKTRNIQAIADEINTRKI